MNPVLVRAHWPSSLCPVNGLHGWVPGAAALICVFCHQFVVWEECAEMQRWNRYWITEMTNVDRLN